MRASSRATWGRTSSFSVIWRINDYYRAAETLPKGTPRTQDTVLPILRANGTYRDSPTTRSTPQALAVRRDAAFTQRAARGWPVGVQQPDQATVNHILHGEGDGKRGGHLYGSGVPGKTEFPADWDETRILDAIRQVMDAPDWTRPAPSERALHRFGKTIDGVQIEVKAYLKDGEYVIDHAYPAGGEGVTRNTTNGRIDVKPSKAKQWKKRDAA